MNHPVDAHVGSQLKTRRAAMGLTQSDVAKHLNISFQQVQKYELGRNRISASKLYDAAQLLQVEVGYFFAGLDNPGVDTLSPQTPEEAKALELFRGQKKSNREAILRILQAAAGEGEAA